jgi:heavy metal sensor kinase
VRIPIRVRLTLWLVLLLGVLLAAFGTSVYLLMRQSLFDNLNESIEGRAAVLARAIQYEGDRPLLADLAPTIDPDRGERFTRVFDTAGAVTFDNSQDMGGVPVDQGALRRALAGEPSIRTTPVSGQSVRIRAVPIRRGDRIIGVLEVGQAEDDVTEALDRLLIFMLAAFPITLMVAGGGGVYFARRALGPVDEITRLARKVSVDDLSQRLDLSLPDDELGKLARTFDEMIARLDAAFRRQRQFTADASHELRTPLTIIKGQIEVSLQRDREPAAYREVLQVTNESVDRLIRLVGSLLTLAQADAGDIPLEREEVDVGAIARSAMEQVQPRAEEIGVELRHACGPEAVVRADQDLVLQLILNLLDNALKHTAADGAVAVTWRGRPGAVELVVEDTGEGIADEHLPYLFDRFYRVDRARSRDVGGAGLGLAICRWIAEAHGGSIAVSSVVGEGSRFTVTLPAGPTQS